MWGDLTARAEARSKGTDDLTCGRRRLHGQSVMRHTPAYVGSLATAAVDERAVGWSPVPWLAADSVVETEMSSEIPRNADLRDQGGADDRDHGDEQSEAAHPGADRSYGEGQK
ncbi:MAG: hypothetical protein JWQ86_2877 [Mycobacterium sp.]|nr:hypothetical protein [Mycobacterium sp.]